MRYTELEDLALIEIEGKATSIRIKKTKWHKANYNQLQSLPETELYLGYLDIDGRLHDEIINHNEVTPNDIEEIIKKYQRTKPSVKLHKKSKDFLKWLSEQDCDNHGHIFLSSSKYQNEYSKGVSSPSAMLLSLEQKGAIIRHYYRSPNNSIVRTIEICKYD